MFLLKAAAFVGLTVILVVPGSFVVAGLYNYFSHRFWCHRYKLNHSQYDKPILGPASAIKEYGMTGFYAQLKKENPVYTTFTKGRVVVFDHDMIKHIFMDKFSCFRNRTSLLASKATIIGHSLLSLQDQEWKDVRQVMTGVFTPNRLKGIHQVVNQSCDCLIEKMELDLRNKDGKQDSMLDMCTYSALITIDTIAKIAFNVDIGAYKCDDNQFLSSNRNIMHQFDAENPKNLIIFLVDMMGYDFLPALFPAKWLMPSHVSNSYSYLSNIAADLIAKYDSGDVKNDFLCHMLGLHSKGLITKKHLLAQCVLFLVAGQDTTGISISYFLWEMGRHPDVQDQLHEEIISRLNGEEDKSQLNQCINYDFVQELKYLDACCMETLRLHPPILFTERRCTESCTFPEQNLTLPPGCQVLIPIYLTQRDERLWSDPDEFQPARFLDASSNAHHPAALMPFGHGQRQCIAQRFGLCEMKIIVTRLLLHFRFILPAGMREEPKLSGSLTNQPIDGLKVIVQKRNQ